MEEFNYEADVLDSVYDWLKNNEDEWVNEGDTLEDIREYLEDELFNEDSVTGNASGSFTFDRNKAKENVFADIDSVRNAFMEYDERARFADLFFDEDWETIDVITRCYVLSDAISDALDESDIKEIFKKHHTADED